MRPPRRLWDLTAVPSDDQSKFKLPTYPPPPDPAASGIDLKLGWRKNDPQITADAKAFWKTYDFLPQDADPDKRAASIVYAAYSGPRLAAVSTAFIEQIPFLRCKMAVYGCAVAPDFRGQKMSVLISAHSIYALEDWSLAHPEEEVMGMLAVMQAEKYEKKSHPHRAPETRLSLAYFNAQDQKIVVGWFDHARV